MGTSEVEYNISSGWLGQSRRSGKGIEDMNIIFVFVILFALWLLIEILSIILKITGLDLNKARVSGDLHDHSYRLYDEGI